MIGFLKSTFNPERLFTWPVFFITLGWALSTNLLDTVYNPAGLYLERIAFVTLGHISMFLVIYLGIRLLRLLPEIARSLIMVPLIVIAAISRGFVLWVLFSWIGIDSPEVFFYRVFGPITNMGLPLLISAVALQRIRSYTETRKLLLAESYRLIELKNLAREDMRRIIDERFEQIRSDIFSSLALDSKGAPEQTMNLIGTTIDNIVRPTSHQIEAETFLLTQTSEDVKEVRLNWREAIGDSLSSSFINPVAVAATCFAAGIVFVTSSVPLAAAVFLLLLMGLGVWGTLKMARHGLSTLEARLPASLTRVLFLVFVLIAGFIVGLSSLLVTTQTANPYSLLFVAPFFATGITLLYALAGSAEAQALLANQRLEYIAKSLAWEVSRVSSEYRQLRRSLAHLLHGKIQTGLTSSLIRLKKVALEDPARLPEIEQSIQNELRELIQSANLDEVGSSLDLDKVVADLNQTWEDIAKIQLELNGVDQQALAKDQVLSSTLVELFSELSFNAIKHGKANSIQLVVKDEQPNIISLTCKDNGLRPEDSSRVGLGTKLLDECALSWERVITDCGTETKLLLPFSEQNSSVNS